MKILNQKQIVSLILFTLLTFSCDLNKDIKFKNNNTTNIKFDYYNFKTKSGNDINYFTLLYDSLLINKINKNDFTSHIQVKDDKEYPEFHSDYLFIHHVKYAGQLEYYKHLTYEKMLKNEFLTIKLIEFNNSKYFHKIFIENEKYFRLSWNYKKIPIGEFFDFNNLFIGNTTDTLITNLPSKRIKELFPNFKGVLLFDKSDSLLLDYNQYKIKDEEFYTSIYKQLDKNYK